MTKYLFAIATVLLSYTLFGQNTTVITGTIIDEDGNPMPYVNVYEQNTTNGTSTNLSGQFNFESNSPSASITVVAKFVGYKEYQVSIAQLKAQKGRIKLIPQQVTLSEVVVSAKGKDPAYYIIRQAIKNRKKFLQPLEEYSHKIYMKGKAFFADAPNTDGLLLGMMLNEEDKEEIEKEEGKVIYLTESFSKVYKGTPNKTKEELLASRQTGTAPGFSANRSVFLEESFYQGMVNGVTERGLISPVSPSALIYYDFKLLGKFKEGERLINRIRVIPKRKSDPVFAGEIFITQDIWNIHSLDLIANKGAMDNTMLDSVSFKQSFQNLSDSLWFPLSLQTTYYLNAFGFKLHYEILGRYTDFEYDLEVPKKFFNQEVYLVQDTVQKNDVALMQRLRPILLDSVETTHYRESDSLAAVAKDPNRIDSNRIKGNKYGLGKFINGYTYTYPSKNSISVSGILNTLNFTAVDGVVLKPTINIRLKDAEDRTKNQFAITPRYAVGRNHFDLSAAWDHSLNRKTFSHFIVSGGRMTRHINPTNPISNLFNAYYTYFQATNHAQFVNEEFIQLQYTRELFNGLRGNFSVEYTNRRNLQNLSQLNLYEDQTTIDLRPNINDNANTVTKFEMKLRYRINQRYATYPTYKVLYADGRYPEFYFNLSYAPEELGSSSFVFGEVGLDHQIDLGVFGGFYYSAFAGRFLHKENFSFFDAKHFVGNQVPVIQNLNRSFQTLPYYSSSTQNGYVELHASHHFNGFLLNKIPVLRKAKWQSYAGVNALILDPTTGQSNFYEAFIGIENIFTILSVQFAAPFQNNTFGKPLFQIGINAGL